MPRRQAYIALSEAIDDEFRYQGWRAGAVESRQEMLIRLLRRRFRCVSWRLVLLIGRTNDLVRLDAWLRNFATAQTLADVGLLTPPEE
jgi:hypothetical protein